LEVNGTSCSFALDDIYWEGTPLGVNEFSIIDMSVYPNPTHDSWTIQTKGQDILSIYVYDILGKNVLSISPNSPKAIVDARNLKTGIYFAKIKTIEGYNSVKLVKN